jgi:GcrA cell cycle regulator
MAWTDQRVETLKKLWTEGLSASQIAKEMGEGVTRNAIIGKVHRLKLSGRATPSRPPRPRIKAAPKPRVTTSAPRTSTSPVVARETPIAPPPLEPTPLPSGEFATVLTLTNHICKWPIGDPTDPDFRFCGRKSKAASPYCDSHASQAYQPQSRRRRRGPESAKAALDALANARRRSV